MSLQEMIKAKEKGICPFCGKDMQNAEFRDERSFKEFTISGLCQDCQDKMFGVD